MASILRAFMYLMITAIFVFFAATAYFYWSMTQTAISGQLPAQITINQGDNIRAVAQKLKDAQVNIPMPAFTLWARATGKASQLKAGVYLIETTMTPLALLTMMVEGRTQLSKVAILEGWTFQKMRQAINAHPDLIHDTADWTDAQILDAIGAEEGHPEGLFFPDTYHFSPQTQDLDIFKQAYSIMQKKLEAGWEARDPAIPYQNAYEALIIASLIEKESGHPDDRAKVAGVFVNRIQLKMRLQSDPTVIYGMGNKYQGRIRKVDLTTDTPYNTYTRYGLPPTPIALPGHAAIEAALRPEKTDAIFFVAKGDNSGMSHFTTNLKDHNAAVNQYWQRRKDNAKKP